MHDTEKRTWHIYNATAGSCVATAVCTHTPEQALAKYMAHRPFNGRGLFIVASDNHAVVLAWDVPAPIAPTAQRVEVA